MLLIYVAATWILRAVFVGYPTNQNLGNTQLNPPHKKSILEDSYINHDILSSRSQLRQLSASSTLNFVDSQFRQSS